ncbi:MAG: ribosomal RNA small subunit methyltransferase A [Acidobacteria bacterium RIFCSPLOWO2_12_FULL_54_10]|nr:MAG: ribosomal RNA small subunit methyltransferase A [Acidobacteria bacterium RIFCSPLOWO2_12_FULL_54_10]
MVVSLHRPSDFASYNRFVKRNHRPPLGQVFLTDKRLADRIVRSLCLKPDDAVLEIGAGPGNMTEKLAETGASVWAVEIDSRWADKLKEKFPTAPHVRILQADILTVPLDQIANQAGREKIRVFGNLPYYITSPCLLHLFHYHPWIDEIIVMVQYEVAQRIVAMPGDEDYGLLSLTCRYYTEPSLLFPVPAKAFRPVPKVKSAIVRMRISVQKDRLGIKDEETFWRWMKAAFSQRRKTLINNWKTLCDPERLAAVMDQAGVDRKERAENLSLEQLVSLMKAAHPN